MFRPITEHDVDPLVELARSLHNVAPWRHAPFSEGRLRAALRGALRSDKHIVQVLDDGSGTLYGVVVASVEYSFFTDTRYVVDNLIYVDEDHRSLRTLRSIVRMLEQWARDVGANAVSIGTSYGDNAHKMVKALRRFGYSFGAITYTKRL